MNNDPNNILAWDFWDDMGGPLDDIPSASEEDQTKTCPDCKGKKIIYLFTTYETCTLCRGEGKITVPKKK